jgi:diguanylate cyclase (GGDEF)-like protein
VPAAICLLLTAAAVLGFVMWTTQGIDRRALERETDLAARAVERQLRDIKQAQESVTIWDDALVHTMALDDKSWLDNNLGTWLYEFYGFHAACIYAATGELIYSSEATISPAPALFEAEAATLAPLLADVRVALRDPAAERGSATLDIKPINGHPAVVSVAPIVSETGEIAQEPGTEPLHVVIVYLDQTLADAMAHSYRLEGAAFSSRAETADGHASYPLFDDAGRVVTFLSWKPNRPGVEMLNQTAPALVVAFLIAAALVVALLRRLWKSSSALEAERLEARHQAAHDSLTGLPNRSRFEQSLRRALGDANRRHGRVALLMLDLDRFKHVNDTLGHHAGDDLIRAVSQRLAAMVPQGDLLARLGGDEFAIIHTSPADRRDATQMARGIVEAMSKPFDVAGSEAFVGASIGLAIAGEDDRDQIELTRKADIALYEAKARGRGRVVVYEEAMNEQLQDRHQIEGDLREALRRGDQLAVAFQPLFLADGSIAGAEALLRWNHPRFGAVSPARFVPIAEGAGLIEPLGEFVLRKACALSARFPGRRIAVNISPAQLRNPKFPEQVFDLLVETAMRPSDLELEITEGILLDNEGPALEALTTFRKAGVRIALDDFGTGYSSLSYLKRYPVDCIKIDRSFVAQLAPSSSSAAIVEAMVRLAHALEIEVTAEGVETRDQLDLLTAMGCNLFQGFLLSPPISPDAVEGKFRGEDRRAAPLARAS